MPTPPHALAAPTPPPDPEALRAALRSLLGYPDFRPGQEPLVRAALSRRDALGILPTGGGKSVCYQLPASLLPGVTLVVSPLVSLMDDQVVRAREAGVGAARLDSTVAPAARRRAVEDARAGRVKLLFLAPERLESPRFAAALATLPVALLAVDEAHCISQWGHDFRPSYLRLGRLRERLGCHVLAVTATATPRAREEIARVLRLRDPVQVVGRFDRANLSWQVVRVRDRGERRARLRALVRSVAGPTVVYAATRRDVEVLRREIAGLGIRAGAYHGGLDAAVRADVQGDFMEGRTRVVVATNAFGMGVDKPDVRLVVHWQLPGTLEAYYQEGGRAGRDGAPAACVALSGAGDDAVHRGFVDRAHPGRRELRRWLAAVRAAVGRGGEGTIRPSELARARGRGRTPGEALQALTVLARAGAVRWRGGAARAGERVDEGGAVPDDPVGVTIPARPADLAREARLREAALARLGSVRRYARTRGCRRAVVLRYFGENDAPRRCGGCDRCLGTGDPLLGVAVRRGRRPL